MKHFIIFLFFYLHQLYCQNTGYSCTSVSDCNRRGCTASESKLYTGPSGNIYDNGAEIFYGCSCVAGGATQLVEYSSFNGYYYSPDHPLAYTMRLNGYEAVRSLDRSYGSWLPSNFECNKCVHSERFYGYVDYRTSSSIQALYNQGYAGLGPNGQVRDMEYCKYPDCTNVCDPGYVMDIWCVCQPCPSGYWCKDNLKYQCTTCVSPSVQNQPCLSTQDTVCLAPSSTQWIEVWAGQQYIWNCLRRCDRGTYETKTCVGGINGNRECALCPDGFYCLGDRDANNVDLPLTTPSKMPMKCKRCNGPDGNGGGSIPDGNSCYSDKDMVCKSCKTCGPSQWAPQDSRCSVIYEASGYAWGQDNICLNCIPSSCASNQYEQVPCTYWTQRVCASCLSGYYCNGVKQSMCDAGYYCVNAVKYPCAPNSISADKATACTPCPTGMVNNYNYTLCVAPSGFYYDSSTSSLQSCLPGKVYISNKIESHEKTNICFDFF